MFRAAVDACDPERLVRDTLAELRMARMVAGRARIGVAMGKAALGMARGCGAVTRGEAVGNADDGDDLPPGWTKMIAGHPEPDVRSLEAGDAVIDAVASAMPARRDLRGSCRAARARSSSGRSRASRSTSCAPRSPR